MARPPAYERDYSFSDWETNNPGQPKPGAALDTEFDDVSNALTATQDALALIQRDDGQLANDSVGVDQLQDDVFDGIVDGITAEAEAARDAAAASADASAVSASAANTANSAAQTHANNAAGAAAQAGISQDIAQTAASEADAAASQAEAARDAALVAQNETEGHVAETQAAVELAEAWATQLPDAVDDGRYSAQWWALRAEEVNSTSTLDFGTAGTDIGEAFTIWDAQAGNDLPLGQVYATWGSPAKTYVLTDRGSPADPASWTNITGGPGPPNVLSIGTVTSGAPAAATITGTSPAQVLNLTIPPGAAGPAGADGADGAAGPPNTLSIGTVTTLAPGTPATATITGIAPSQTLSLGIPEGQPGSAGSVDHGALLGLADDDHTQYYNQTRGDARYARLAAANTFTAANTFGAVDFTSTFRASGAEGVSGQVLSSQGPGLPTVWRSPGGGSIDLGYNFNTGTTAVNPGSQKLGFNTALYTTVTALYINALAFTNFDANAILSLLQAGNRIYIQARADATKAVVYQVTAAATNNTGWWTVPVTHVNSTGTLFASNADLTCVFMLSTSSSTGADPTADVDVTGDWVHDYTQFFGFTRAEATSLKTVAAQNATTTASHHEQELRVSMLTGTPTITLQRINSSYGSSAAAITNAQPIGQIIFRGSNGVSGNTLPGADITVTAIENFATTSAGSEMLINVTTQTSNVTQNVLRLRAQEWITNPVGFFTFSTTEVTDIKAQATLHGTLDSAHFKGIVKVTRQGLATLTLTRVDGSITTPTATPSGQNMGQITFQGAGGGVNTFKPGARIQVASTALWTTSIAPCQINFDTADATSNSLTTRFQITPDCLLVGAGASRQVAFLSNAALQIEGISTSAAGFTITCNTAAGTGPTMRFAKSRGTALGAVTVVQSGDALGEIYFAGADGSDINAIGAAIQCIVDGTPGADDMPARLMFSTTADGAQSVTERLRITSAGAWGLAGANYGTSGQALTSNGSAAAPTWQSVLTQTAADARYAGLAANNTLTGVQTVTVNANALTGSIHMLSTQPGISWRNTAAGTDEKMWLAYVTTNTWKFSLWNDAGGASLDAISITRTGIASVTLTFGGACSAPSFNATSSRAIKRETGTPHRARDILAKLRPIFYRLLSGDGGEQLGLIAEEVHDICPQLSDGKTVAYDRLALLLLADWQDQRAVWAET